jgi:hypothetical protein
MTQRNSTLLRYSRYVSGGETEVNSRALEWWERDVFLRSDDDFTYVVEKRFENRLDLIAATFLGESRYWWVIAMLNNILDPSTEVTTGVVLYIPTQERAKQLLSGKLGGVTSTRTLSSTIKAVV